MKKLSIFFIIIFIYSMSINTAHAITISPFRYDDVFLEPGKKFAGIISVYNESNVKQTYFFETQNFIADETGENPEFLEGSEGSNNLASWIKMSEKQVGLEPDQQKKISFTIDVPINADPGGYYAAIFLVEESQKQGDILQKNKVGALIMAQIIGDFDNSANVVFSTKPDKSVFSSLPRDFTVNIQNTGSTHFRPDIKIELQNIFGRSRTVYLLNSNKNYVLPQSSRVFESNNNIVQDSFFKNLKNELSFFSFGFYKINYSCDLGVDNLKFSESKNIWIFPFRTIFLMLLSVFFVILYNRIIVKAAIKKRINKK